MSKSRYKAIKVDGVKHDYHRWRMEQELGRKLEASEYVHHIDENKSNNDISNLQIMDRSEHARLHRLGHTLSDGTREKLSKANRGKAHPTVRRLSYDQAEYIRANYIPRDNEFGARALSRRFGISHSHILEIINGDHYINDA